MRINLGSLTLLLLTLLSSNVFGSLTLNIFSNGDANNLKVGEAVGFRVELSGLGPGDVYDVLTATVDMDAGLLGTPTAPTPGAIVTDVTGFLSASNPGQADGLFDSLFAVTNAPISSNGVFFDFTVTPVAPGSGSMFFSFVDGGFLVPPPSAGAALPFTVVAQANAIPEPSSAVLWTIMIGSAILACPRPRLKALYLAKKTGNN